jgi:hypothetical protein
MYVTKKHLSRRTLLKGVGVGVSLPLLDAMITASTALAQTAAAPKPLLGFFYQPHGAVMDRWTPTGEGRDFVLPEILAPFEGHRDVMTIVSGLRNRAAEAPPTHATVPASWLSCMPPRASHDPLCGITIDQIAAQKIGQETPLPSLEISTEPGGQEGACDGGFGCSYSATISFRTPTQPLPMEHNPRKLFFKLFGRGSSPEERESIAARQASILDLVTEDAQALRRDLGRADQALVGEYLESVREIERRAEKMSEQDLSGLDLPEPPIGVQNDFDAQIRLMFDLAALAYQAGLTRIISMMLTAEVSNKTYNHIGVADAFHPLSHHGNAPDKMARLAKVQTYHSEVFATFLDRMKAMPDGEGSMLDHAVFLYGSNMSNSNAHDHYPLPLTVFGKGRGTITGGRHIRYPEETPMANLCVTLLDKAGIHVDSIGDSTGNCNEI